MPQQFGSAISRADADDLFARFIEIKQRSAQLIKDTVANDTDKRFYGGRQATNPLNEDWAFVFSKNILEDLLTNMKNAGADCFFVFAGAKAAAGDEQEGRPTVMLVPAQQVDAPQPTDIAFRIFGDLGFQHPATAGGSLTAPVTLPDTFTKEQVHE